jgi:uncharacterized protein
MMTVWLAARCAGKSGVQTTTRQSTAGENEQSIETEECKLKNDHLHVKANLSGRTALVTGASSGFGTHFARQLAAMGCNLVITARRTDRLEALKSEITAVLPVQVDIVAQDLGQPGAAQALFDQVQALGRPVDLLINNAGFGLKGRFLESPLERQREMVNLNVLAVTELTWLFARPMVERRDGYILFVSSIAEFQPSPMYATYAATKVFVSHFAHALHYELHGTGVNSMIVSPGTSPTEFAEVAKQGRSIMHVGDMAPEEVVRQSLEGLLKGKDDLVPGRMNRVATLFSYYAPRRLKMWSADLMVRD